MFQINISVEVRKVGQYGTEMYTRSLRETLSPEDALGVNVESVLADAASDTARQLSLREFMAKESS